jgi:hypothetical protein
MDKPTPADYRGRTRDPKWEADLVQWLRTQPEESRLSFVLELVNYQTAVALQAAHAVLEERSSFVKMLEVATSTSDASTIRYWLECIVPRLGFRRSINCLTTLAEREGQGVSKALYWLPRLATSDSDKAAIEKLSKLVPSPSRGQ